MPFEIFCLPLPFFRSGVPGDVKREDMGRDDMKWFGLQPG